jgi:hypothetical protein
VTDRSDTPSPRPGSDGGRKPAPRGAKSSRPRKHQGKLPKPDSARKRDDDGGERRLPLKWLTRGRDVLILQEPHCALDRAEDLDEVHNMLAEGESDIARDELLFLVSDCRAFFDAHNLLGRLAAEEGNLPVARGHYGFVYESVLQGLPHGFRGRLPATAGYNRAFFEGGHGLARVLVALEEFTEAGQVLKRLESFDPEDEATRELREEWEELSRPGGAAPLIQLQLAPKPPKPPDNPPRQPGRA